MLNQGQNQQMDDSCSGKIPIFFKIITGIVIITGFISLFTIKLSVYFINFPYFTLFYGNIWRLFTAPLFSMFWLDDSLLFIILLYFILARMEKRASTVVTMINFIFTNLISQLLYSATWLIIYFINKKYMFMFTNGLFMIQIIYLIRICYPNQQSQIKVLCFPCKIKKRYVILIIFLPIALIYIWGIFFLTWTRFWDLIVGVAYGLIQCRFFSCNLIKLKRSIYSSIESSFLFNCIRNRDDFFSLQNCKDSEYFCTNQQTANCGFFYSKLLSSKEVEGRSQGQINNS